jgi:crotonobetainyl-CoA:carnitine CoA-transferase CaiB-like acyl-CoA transferase
MAGPLDGVRIIDLTTVLMGPYATQMLADFGADVVKVEAPQGDVMRRAGPHGDRAMGPLYLHANRNKRSIVLDLKHALGRKAVLDLCRNADVLTYNIRPQAMARLGLGFDDLRAVNPRLIYAGMFGYGRSGPYAAYPAYDDLIQGASGIPGALQRAGNAEPRYAPMNISDRTVGLYAMGAICAALYARERTGQGQAVDIPMFETMAQFVLSDHLYGETFRPAEGPMGYARLMAPDRRPFQTADGHVCVLLYTDTHWRKFFRIADREAELDSDPRFRDLASRTGHIGELYAIVATEMRRRTTADWLALLGEADIPVAKMNSFEDLLADPHLNAIGFFEETEHPTEGALRGLAVPSRWSQTMPQHRHHAPLPGEQTEAILREAGYDDAGITALAEAGVTKALL